MDILVLNQEREVAKVVRQTHREPGPTRQERQERVEVGRQLRLAPRPQETADPAAREINAVLAYGKNYFIKELEQRSSEQQWMLEQRLLSFQNWRRQRGEVLPEAAELWGIPPPEPETVRVYVAKLSVGNRQHCSRSFSALRLYFKHWARPDLYRLVERIKR